MYRLEEVCDFDDCYVYSRWTNSESNMITRRLELEKPHDEQRVRAWAAVQRRPARLDE
jgi:hypothetical protein